MHELVSIIVPIYNVESYLYRCLTSLRKQSYSDIEVILVDDGSLDNSSQICREFCESDSRFQYFHKLNGGLSDARNFGIEQSHGNILFFVDSDDYIDELTIEKMMNARTENNADIVVCARYVVHPDGTKVVVHLFSKSSKMTPTEAISELLTYGKIEESTWDKLYSKSLFDNIKFPVGEINEDLVTIPWLIEKCNKVYYLNEPLYFYCQNDGSISRSGYSSKFSICVEHIRKVALFCDKRFPQLSKQKKIFYARYCASLLTYMLNDSISILRFKDDFDFYNKNFRRYFFYYLLCPHFTVKDKLRNTLIYLHLYKFIKSIKKRGRNRGN